MVPDWPTNIAYFCTTPDEETAFYNSFYGPNGKFPYWPTDRTYDQIIDYEAGVGLQHVVAGSINTHTFHIANTYDYGSGRTLVTDWLESVVGKYAALYAMPLLNPAWPDLGAYTTERGRALRAARRGRGRGLRPVRRHHHGHLAGRRLGAGLRRADGGLHHVRHATSRRTSRSTATTAVTVTAAPRA